MNEHTIQSRLRIFLSPLGAFFRANVGQGWTGVIQRRTGTQITLGDPRPLSSGLPKGFTDIFGLTPVVITPEMVGRTIGVFCAFEVKSAKGKPTEEQGNFIAQILRRGGIAGIVRSNEDAKKLIDDYIEKGVDS